MGVGVVMVWLLLVGEVFSVFLLFVEERLVGLLLCCGCSMFGFVVVGRVWLVWLCCSFMVCEMGV